tara:strand:+ start:3260 stop:4207 length:948 start_codon:yes stop_codon:yes gene_type:complete
MKIAIVADKKSGDLSHCLGLRDVLQNYDPKKDIFFLHKELISFPGFLERLLRLINEKFLLFILRLLNPSVVDYKFDFVICAGTRTAVPAYLLAKASNAKIIYIGTPKLRIIKKFDGVVSENSDISKVYKVIASELPPTKFKPYENKLKPSRQSLILIGGDGNGYDYTEKDWYRLAFEFKNIGSTFINSKKTPKFAWENLKENSGQEHKHLDVGNTSLESFTRALDTHSHIFVTADSTTRISEIISRGYFINVIEMKGPIQYETHHDFMQSLQKKGLLKILRLDQLHLSENKYHEDVKKFVVTERDALKSKLQKLL